MAGRVRRATRYVLTWSPPVVHASRDPRALRTSPGWLVRAVGLAPTAGAVLATLVLTVQHVAAGRYLQALVTPVVVGGLTFTCFALVPYMAQRGWCEAPRERRIALAPIVWCTAATSLAWLALFFLVAPPDGTTASGRLNVLVLGIFLQGAAWLLGTLIGHSRAQQQAALAARAVTTPDSGHAR